MRLFTAIDISEQWRRRAIDTQAVLAREFEAELRFVAPAQLHVTIRFLGEVAEERVPALVDAIERLPPFSFDLELQAAGTFGPPSRPTVVWLGVEIGERDAIELLLHLDRAISEAGVSPSEQAWRPHLTLARVRRQVVADRRRELAEAVRRLPVSAPESFTITGLSLYRSDLGNRAVHHKLLARSAVS